MKKLLGIVVLGLLLASSNLFAESFKLNQFNKWLSDSVAEKSILSRSAGGGMRRST